MESWVCRRWTFSVLSFYLCFGLLSCKLHAALSFFLSLPNRSISCSNPKYKYEYPLHAVWLVNQTTRNFTCSFPFCDFIKNWNCLCSLLAVNGDLVFTRTFFGWTLLWLLLLGAVNYLKFMVLWLKIETKAVTQWQWWQINFSDIVRNERHNSYLSGKIAVVMTRRFLSTDFYSTNWSPFHFVSLLLLSQLEDWHFSIHLLLLLKVYENRCNLYRCATIKTLWKNTEKFEVHFSLHFSQTLGLKTNLYTTLFGIIEDIFLSYWFLINITYASFAPSMTDCSSFWASCTYA